MTAPQTTPPPPAGINTAELFEPDRRDWLRMLGGVLLGAGAVVLWVRKFEPWADFPLFLTVLLPFVVIFGLGWLAGTRRGVDGAERPEGWQIVFLIIGSLLAGLVMAQLILMLGAEDLDNSLHQALVAAAIAGAAYAASFLRRIPFLALIGGLAALWAYLALFDKIIDVDSIDKGRVLLLIFAALMLAGGVALRRDGREQADDFITVAGVAAVIAGLLSVSNLTGALDPIEDSETRPSEAWNIFILAVSLALITFGAKARTRGPSYVGALGLVAFIGLTGSNVVALSKGNEDDVSKFLGWPVVLLLLGLAALALSFFLPRAPGRGWWQTTAPDGGAGPAGQVDQPTQAYPQQPTQAYPQQPPRDQQTRIQPQPPQT